MQIVDAMVLNLYFNKTIPCVEIRVWLLCTSAFSMARLLSAGSRPREHLIPAQKYGEYVIYEQIHSYDFIKPSKIF